MVKNYRCFIKFKKHNLTHDIKYNLAIVSNQLLLLNLVNSILNDIELMSW